MYGWFNGADGRVGFFSWLTGSYKVLSTDYTNYTLIYNCDQYFGFWKNEYVWILSRTPTLDSSILANVHSILQSKVPSYELSNFYTTNQGSQCVYYKD